MIMVARTQAGYRFASKTSFQSLFMLTRGDVTGIRVVQRLGQQAELEFPRIQKSTTAHPDRVSPTSCAALQKLHWRCGTEATTYQRGGSYVGELLAFDPMPSGGSGPQGPFCTSCQGPIAEGQRSVRVSFNSDPQGYRGLSGLYHEQCSKVFVSLARIINMTSHTRF